MAEAGVEAHYRRVGAATLARRWRGRAGELDLVLRCGGTVVVVEVKSAASHDDALQRLSRRQAGRICRAAAEFCATLPADAPADLRIDLAVVDRHGRVVVLKGAIWEE